MKESAGQNRGRFIGCLGKIGGGTLDNVCSLCSFCSHIDIALFLFTNLAERREQKLSSFCSFCSNQGRGVRLGETDKA